MKTLRRIRGWFWRRLAGVVERHYGAYLIHRGDWVGVRQSALDVNVFCDRSGFLRDGRYPGGRHAERKIRKRVVALCLYAEQGAVGPWMGSHWALSR